MERFEIHNRDGARIVGILDLPSQAQGLVFVAHGLGSSKNSPRIALIAETFLEKGFAVVRFDTTNTFGESDGDYQDATVTNYLHDLEDVIAWAKTQPWYHEPFALAGSSLGAFTTLLFSEAHPKLVRALAPVAPVVSGDLRVQAAERRDPGSIAKWREAGIRVEQNSKRPGGIERLKWNHIEDSTQYDTRTEADQLTMPVLLIVGDADDITPQDHVRLLYDALPEGNKRLEVVPSMGHGFSEEFFPQVKATLSEWIDSWL
ncbi:MAG: alpha/beta fold hydrolase [Candidatus Kaiserbacteria bacterium]|nr:alpha/beta fold hydrolase [Candidatus Kaiserbacteria bacterium]